MTALTTTPPVRGTDSTSAPLAATLDAVTPSAAPAEHPDTADLNSDQALLARVREGDRAAFGILWGRHRAPARAIAWRYRGLAEPEDIIQEASRMILGSLLRGNGPFGDFRPYLTVAVRNAAISLGRRRVPEPVGDAIEVGVLSADQAPDASASVVTGMVMARAFKNLPARWQEVLWYVCIEDLSMGDAGSLLGLSPNATAALAKRARQGLRMAWIGVHVQDDRFGARCRELSKDYLSHVRDTLDADRRRVITEHLARCASCADLVDELTASWTG